jgi:hypothetical protein
MAVTERVSNRRASMPLNIRVTPRIEAGYETCRLQAPLVLVILSTLRQVQFICHLPHAMVRTEYLRLPSMTGNIKVCCVDIVIQSLFIFSNIGQPNQPPSVVHSRLNPPHYGTHSMASGPISSRHSPDQRDPYHMWGPPLSELQALSRRQTESNFSADRKKSVDLLSKPRRDSSIQRIFDNIHKEAGIA